MINYGEKDIYNSNLTTQSIIFNKGLNKKGKVYYFIKQTNYINIHGKIMKISSMFNNSKPVFSLEIFPPKRTGNIQSIYDTVEKLKDLNPDFISVTYGAGGSSVNNLTCEITSTIKKNHNIETVAHLTCVNSSKEDVKEMIKHYVDNGIENIMALRGDKLPEEERKTDFNHSNQLAIELQRQCHDNIEILGACYPEGHYESTNLDDDIQNLKYKIGAGAEVLISQLFFDNQLFYSFIDKVRSAGITVPISAGIMPIVTTTQIEKTVALSGASLPIEFTKMISSNEHDPKLLYEAGIQYASDQIRDLLNSGVDGIHLYTMNKADVSRKVYEKIKDLL